MSNAQRIITKNHRITPVSYKRMQTNPPKATVNPESNCYKIMFSQASSSSHRNEASPPMREFNTKSKAAKPSAEQCPCSNRRSVV
ncbi:hypothetical protein CALVIDRAFT_250487 [Calocera viscosa TUFC12733]|uniref:Uncharacterized protein n=1 Tax=Calocera viscosa (strain TUFC12733) TaxID=1330018 RepID=A0A167JEQ4_CALVF|nr:hypothetical protein CALVIDRAFT_250487 [Calocera viscosa TUFC12733]